MLKTLCVLAIGMLGASALTACHSPSGGVMPYTGASTTYYSTEMSHKTVSVIDLRSNSTIFSVDIPPGKQLTIDFDSGEGDDPVDTPDLMRYEIMDLGTRIGTLHNSMTVPNAASRRVDVAIHKGPRYAAQPPQRPLRTDELADRPAWWTPEGGPMPEDNRLGMYDH
jgi:hypothetical protein